MAYFDDHSPESLAEEAARQAVLQQEAREAPAGTFPVVLAAGDSGILLHEAVGHGLEADFNRKETSNYSNRIGQSVASELVTVIDDATLNLSRGSVNIDDEGEVAGHNLLIENGQLAAYMQDRISSDHYGVTPSGNGRRQSFRHAPMPRMTNTYMTAGRRRAGRSHPARRVRHFLQGLQRRTGQHHQRRLRLFRHRGLSDRERSRSPHRSATST